MEEPALPNVEPTPSAGSGGDFARSPSAESFRLVAAGLQASRPARGREAPVEEPALLGRRAREREARRREIFDTARRLFAAHGFQGMTLDDLALQTEFAKPTLYQYFDSKEQLFYAILGEGYGDLQSIVLKAVGGGGGAAAQFRTICVMFLIYFRKHLDFFQIHRQFGERLRRPSDNPWHDEVKRRHDEVLGGMQGLFLTGSRSGEFRPMDARKVCALFLEAVAVYTNAFREERELRTAHEMADEIVGLFLDGLRAV